MDLRANDALDIPLLLFQKVLLETKAMPTPKYNKPHLIIFYSEKTIHNRAGEEQELPSGELILQLRSIELEKREGVETTAVLNP